MCIVRREFGLQITRDVGRLSHMKCFNSTDHGMCLVFYTSTVVNAT